MWLSQLSFHFCPGLKVDGGSSSSEDVGEGGRGARRYVRLGRREVGLVLFEGVETPSSSQVFLGALEGGSTILFKIITRIKLLFSKYLRDYSYSFQGSSELISITVTVSLFLLQNAVTESNSPQEFLGILSQYSYIN